jgi:2-hydroxychromene-2-carboxylate isomerase
VQLDFWFDLSCPYAYLASQRLGRSLAGRAVELRYKPMLLGGVFRATGAGEGPMASLPPAKRQNLALDLMRWADLDQTPMQTPSGHPMRTVRALRTLLGLPEETWPRAVHELYASYWQRGEDVTSDDVIAAALGRAGLDEATIKEALAGADSEARKEDLRARTDEAVRLGIFGAPAFVAHTEGGPTLIWGQDRMMWVEALLDGWRPPAPPPADPRLVEETATRSPRQLDFYFDTSSPFAYLGLTQIARVARGHQLRLRPILLGGLFRAIGTADVPLFAFPQAKRRYVTSELALWSSWWQVPVAFPRKFPQRTQTVQRILLGAAGDPELQLRLAIAFGRAMWAEGQDLEDEAVVATILAAEGGDAQAIAQSKEAAAKEALIAATSEAAAAGVFGVPTCIVHDGSGARRFWGQDRLTLVSAALAGWRAGGEAG